MDQERRHARSIRDRARIAVPLALAWGVGVAVMAAVASQSKENVGQLLMDPSFTLGTRWYTGLVSNLGILAWTVGCAAAFAGAWLCRLGNRDRAARFLLGGCVVGALLLLDDLFQFHSVLLPSEFNAPKFLGEAILGVALVWWALTYLGEIRRTHFHLLIAAGIGFGLSLVVDSAYAPVPGQGWNIIEDGAKFLGILAWSAYFVATTRDICRSVFVDALNTWPDAAYESEFGVLDEAAESDASTEGNASGPAVGVAVAVPADERHGVSEVSVDAPGGERRGEREVSVDARVDLPTDVDSDVKAGVEVEARVSTR